MNKRCVVRFRFSSSRIHRSIWDANENVEHTELQCAPIPSIASGNANIPILFGIILMGSGVIT